MQILSVRGGAPLRGSIPVSGAKNSVLPILAACAVCRGVSVLHNCPDISDVGDTLEMPVSYTHLDVYKRQLPYLGIEPDYTSEDIRGVNVAMPELVGMTEQEASEALGKKSLRYRVIGDGALVTDQIPAADAEVPGDSEVILYMGCLLYTSNYRAATSQTAFCRIRRLTFWTRARRACCCTKRARRAGWTAKSRR